MRGGRTRARLAGVVAVLALTGCGGGGIGGGGGGSTATFVVFGTSITVTESGRVKESYGTNPALSYSGPQGCQGHYFTADNNDIPLTFRYSSQDAYLVYNQTVYHFVTGPQLAAGKLVWDHTFGGDRIVARVSCPPPPPSGPLLPPSY